MHQRLTARSILAVAPVSSYEGFNTSWHRVKALRALGHKVTVLDPLPLQNFLGARKLVRRTTNRLFRLGLPVPLAGGRELTDKVHGLATSGKWDWLWLEKSLDIGPATIERIRFCNPGIRVVGFSPDDMGGRHNQSKQFLDALQHYDLFLTTKTYNVDELRALGGRNVAFVGNGYDPEEFRPDEVSGSERSALGGDVGFIGTWEEDRAAMLVAVADAGIRVRVWGGPWHRCTERSPNLKLEHEHLYFDHFRKACAAFKINLNFLRKLNRDLQTTRSVEIPACGGFMLAERTDEHSELFREGVEAEFFSSQAELIDKCRYYLGNDEKRHRIAKAGHQRCLDSGYSNVERLRAVLKGFE